MAQFEAPTAEAIEASQVALEANEYPGRVLIQGLSAYGNMALQVYALMGRSEGSRNRIFVEEDTGIADNHGIRVTAPDKTPEEMAETENAALIYYWAMEHYEDTHVVSNGAQTGHILSALMVDQRVDLLEAVQSAPTIDGVDLTLYEPDSPNNTPRISGVINLHAKAADRFGMAIVRKEPVSRVPIYSSYKMPQQYPPATLQPGVGFGLQTYNGNGSPLPSFDQAPYPVALGEDVEDTAHAIWGLLNRDNRVALVVKGIDLAPPPFGNSQPTYHIINERE